MSGIKSRRAKQRMPSEAKAKDGRKEDGHERKSGCRQWVERYVRSAQGSDGATGSW